MRSIDHLVMPFETLAAARGWFERLGFLVAPDAVHPFGTGNACIFFADGRYLEPLAVAEPAVYEQSRDDGHLFVERDAMARHADAPPAISGLAFRSMDAWADREQLLTAGFGEEGLVEFSRAMRLPDGGATDLAFRLAFAAVFSAGAPSFFYVEARHRVTPDRSMLTRHPNGARGIVGVTLATREPQVYRSYLAAVTGAEVRDGGGGTLSVSLENGRLDVISGDVDTLAVASATIAVADLAFAREFWQSREIDCADEDDAVSIACPNGTGRIRFIEDRS
ncbi:VOC family protein [Aurantimonas sp. VKM B-3413]|uniref:VOC family protein n=1 Tax=Aurantimonas sp. VKM B-3413 TaxID=2779401 RepID=UPI001E31F010|nr:VOC family protein [Aurantimonas sp. VKM B-3413]MCB8838552.1 VOC family protein [Aurantimonas sp. VKM B-3413]